MWNIRTNYLCVAISGLSGCGNTSVSTALSKMLGVRCINYTLRSLAEDEGIAFDEMRALAEQDSQWDLLVDEKQNTFAMSESCVIGSRLAIWLIPSASVRIYLEVDESVRIERIQKRESGDIALIQTKTVERDLNDYTRYKRLYDIDTKQYKQRSDLIIDANTIGVDDVVGSIIDVLLQRDLIQKI